MKSINSINIMIKAFFVVIILAVLAEMTIPFWTKQEADMVVTGAIVKQYKDEDQKYLVFTDHGVFENTDAWQYFKFNSSDVQGQLMQPGKYHVRYYGFRVPFMSMYPNIIAEYRITH